MCVYTLHERCMQFDCSCSDCCSSSCKLQVLQTASTVGTYNNRGCTCRKEGRGGAPRILYVWRVQEGYMNVWCMCGALHTYNILGGLPLHHAFMWEGT